MVGDHSAASYLLSQELKHCLLISALSLDGSFDYHGPLRAKDLQLVRAIQLSWLAFGFPCLLIAVSMTELEAKSASKKLN